jgi:hypothetical protein
VFQDYRHCTSLPFWMGVPRAYTVESQWLKAILANLTYPQPLPEAAASFWIATTTRAAVSQTVRKKDNWVPIALLCLTVGSRCV